ncbi:MAG: rhodanese-like domain-containing protein [Gammaproteobacteria bacterium]|nr:rhodanese-like domain-containing protein [Gammaproteobacteria bacterium]
MQEPKSITSKEAWQMLQDNPKAILVDVRSNMEFLFVGHPTGAIHVPWIDEPDWKINTHFATDIRQLILGGLSDHHNEANVPIILICRSGKRSLEAGDLLIEEGFTEVYNITEGFEGELDENHHRSTTGGWRFDGLPWEQC